MNNADQLLYEVSDGIATITINRPDARNALNRVVRDGIRGAITAFSADDAAKVLIITATGSVAFCAGADLKEMSAAGLTIPPDDFIPLFDTDKPVIALVNGVALAGGFFLVQQADIVIAAQNARFGITEARHGRGAPWAAPLSLLIPPKVAMEMLLTAETISASRALEIGLINAVVPYEALAESGRKMAERIISNAPLSVKAGKKMVTTVMRRVMGETYTEVNEIWAPVYLSSDAQEGPLAFSEKRTPQWKGK